MAANSTALNFPAESRHAYTSIKGNLMRNHTIPGKKRDGDCIDQIIGYRENTGFLSSDAADGAHLDWAVKVEPRS